MCEGGKDNTAFHLSFRMLLSSLKIFKKFLLSSSYLLMCMHSIMILHWSEIYFILRYALSKEIDFGWSSWVRVHWSVSWRAWSGCGGCSALKLAWQAWCVGTYFIIKVPEASIGYTLVLMLCLSNPRYLLAYYLGWFFCCSFSQKLIKVEFTI